MLQQPASPPVSAPLKPNVKVPMRMLKLIFLTLCFAPFHIAYAGSPECSFPSRASEPFVWVNAGNSGNWEKTIPRVGTQKGYFRFIYFAKTSTRGIKLYVEAWEYMTVGHDLFVGCIEINDRKISDATEARDFKFRPTESGDDATYLDMVIYNKRLDKSAPYSVKIPFKFINNIS